MKSTRNTYLKIIYLLEIQNQKVRVTDIANKLNYTKSSVSKALKRLSENNLIQYETYGDIVLTKEAKCIAEQLILKENLLELFFVGILNISEQQAKIDVDIISEFVSDETNIKLQQYIKKSLHLDNEFCKCNINTNPKCSECETKKINNRIKSNPKWLNILKEDK